MTQRSQAMSDTRLAAALQARKVATRSEFTWHWATYFTRAATLPIVSPIVSPIVLPIVAPIVAPIVSPIVLTMRRVWPRRKFRFTANCQATRLCKCPPGNLGGTPCGPVGPGVCRSCLFCDNFGMWPDARSTGSRRFAPVGSLPAGRSMTSQLTVFQGDLAVGVWRKCKRAGFYMENGNQARGVPN